MSPPLVVSKSLAYRLVLAIVLFSSLLALFSTTVQLFFEYRRDLSAIDATLEQIPRSHVAAIVSSLWVYDLALIDTQLRGIKNLPDIGYVGIRKDDSEVIDLGGQRVREGLVREFSLSHRHRGEDRYLGTLVVDISMEGVYRRLWARVLVILVTQTAKTFVVSIFIVVLFYFMVGRHLQAMAEFARTLGLHNLRRPLQLSRSKKADDELATVEKAINNMRSNLLSEIETVKTAQAALAESEERFRTLVANIPGIVYRCTPTAPWRVEFISESIKEISGFSSHEFINGDMAYGGLIHPDDIERVAGEVRRRVDARQFFAIEYRLVDKDGDEHHMFEKGMAVYGQQGEPLWLDGVILDLTEHKRTERKLLERELLLHSIIENTSDAIFYKDLQGQYLLANTATLKAVGRSEEQVLGKTDAEIFPGDSAQIIRQNDLAVIESGQSLIAEESLKTAYGDTFWQANKSPLFDSDGRVLGLVGISRNITELKAAQRRNEELERRFLQTQKMETVGRLAGGVAHDFNNMLGVILGHSEMALASVKDDPLLREALEEIDKAARRSAALTNQLLAFARQQTVAPRLLDLNQAVVGMLKMLSRVIGEQIDLAWQPAGGIMMVNIDPTQVEQLLVNLCVNARDAIADVGRITISTRLAASSHPFIGEPQEVPAGDYVVLEVDDNGIGMDRDTLAHLFEPFFTTKEIGQGTGLGLATVYGIVQQNGGGIHVDSVPDQGSKFTIYLPRAQGELSPETTIVAARPDGGGECILLVEDEPMLLAMTRTMLERQGYQVLAAGGAMEAVRLAEERGVTISLLITDVVMPEVNGRDLAATVLAHCPGIPCLFMSGYTADVIAHHGVLDGGVHFLQKPFSAQELAIKVREALHARHDH
jgi:two-component system, cell cycle sensor histidine kinase and response regulator CckA